MRVGTRRDTLLSLPCVFCRYYTVRVDVDATVQLNLAAANAVNRELWLNDPDGASRGHPGALVGLLKGCCREFGVHAAWYQCVL